MLDFAGRTVCVLASAIPATLGATVLIDFPCGDQQWAPELRARMPGVKYIGVDAMPGLIQRNIETFLLAELDAPDVFADIKRRSGGLWADADTVVVLSRHVLEHKTQCTADD